VPWLAKAHSTVPAPVPVWTKVAPAALVNREPATPVVRLALSCNVKTPPARLFQKALPLLLSKSPSVVLAAA